MIRRRAIAAVVAGLLTLLVGAGLPLSVGAADPGPRAERHAGDGAALLPAPARAWAPVPDQPDAAPDPGAAGQAPRPQPAPPRPAARRKPAPLVRAVCPPARGPPAAAS